MTATPGTGPACSPGGPNAPSAPLMRINGNTMILWQAICETERLLETIMDIPDLLPRPGQMAAPDREGAPRHQGAPSARGGRTLALVALLAVCVAAGQADAASPTQADFLGAVLRLDGTDAGDGRTVRSFLGCLANFHAGSDGTERPPQIEHPSGSVFRVSAQLETPTVFHFQVGLADGLTIAVVTRIEYKVGDRGFAQITDREAKRIVVTSVCRRGLPGS